MGGENIECFRIAVEDTVDLSKGCREGLNVRVLDEKELGLGEKLVSGEVMEECTTPRGSIFDPFAPAEGEKFGFAPAKKGVKFVVKYPIRRKLDFKGCFGDVCDDEEEERVLEWLRVSIFEFIVSTQLKEMGEKEDDVVEECSLCEGLRTPTLVPLLTGVAETCLDAPKKARPVVRKNVDGLCRRLDFGDD